MMEIIKKQNMNNDLSASEQLEFFAPDEMGGISLEDIFTAYFDCRRHKRGTYNALAFEVDYERKCVELWHAINAGSYRPARSVVFIIFKPVQREIFAPSFESRVVDHLIADKVGPLLENTFIDDNYATRKGKGTLYGINRVYEHIRNCSAGYTRDCYVLKLDIRSFFMSISKEYLCAKMSEYLKTNYKNPDLPALLFILRAILMDNPEKHCVRRCPRSHWEGLPVEKSLFNGDGRHGLPIGRLTSQLCAAFMLDPLDHLVTGAWGVPYYGRYVDDMILVHESKAYLLEVKDKICHWLSDHGLVMHPRKIYLQYYRKGVTFIGGMLMPGRIYVSDRSFGFCMDFIESWNHSAHSDESFAGIHAAKFVSVLNSYLGHMSHFASYNLRKKVVSRIGKEWWRVMYIHGHYEKAVVKKNYSKNAVFQPFFE
jgi:RNA-directed DNA polymerase